MLMMTGRIRALAHVAAALATALLPIPVSAPAAAAPAGVDDRPGHARTRAAMERAVRDGAPGVLVTVVDGKNRWTGTAGVADRDTKRPPRSADHFRVGSITKTFTATLVLQLEAEGRLSIDDTVETWLPGLVRGNGHDGRRITVRQLLNHTSGVYNYLNDPALHQIGPVWLQHLHETWTPGELLAVAMSKPPAAAPGARFVYSNTNYLLAALIVERITGNSYEHELHRRIIAPLRLRETSAPGTRELLPQPSGRAYSTAQIQAPLPGVDVTEFDASPLRASGELISTADDLNRFYGALLAGRLLPRAQLREMTRTVSAGTDNHGLGLSRMTTSCGIELWGQRGGGYGFEALTISTRDARHRMTVYFNTDHLAPEGASAREVTDAEFCPRS
ncbi:D-alanyl-D-alanine carboxypeptidase [Streptomyces sp. RB5]|uniref:D-alanyl-D-alanine carboxypeptidase n=1 Tax=Streptomyces smaragdinus TaxID=2585196 RepID=A0A7K0CA39_9ACTN|nr:serine hydrolase domain-containing protein [Streptomyces smaragdinus]MQY10002.1 D-alanyl-D-alanine carboxypeptidase [Streptomyces smaragdinus]